MVEVVLLKNVRFGGYWRFGVFGLHGHLDPIVIFVFGFGCDLPPHFQVLWIQWCKKPTIIYHHLEDMGGLTFAASGWLFLGSHRIWKFGSGSWYVQFSGSVETPSIVGRYTITDKCTMSGHSLLQLDRSSCMQRAAWTRCRATSFSGGCEPESSPIGLPKRTSTEIGNKK